MSETPIEPKGKPTREQMRAVYEALPDATTDTLFEMLQTIGYNISRATVGRAIQAKFAEPRRTQRKEKAKFRKQSHAANVMINEAVPVAEAVRVVVAKTEAVTGEKMPKAEIDFIERDIAELNKMEVPELHAVREKDTLIYGILLLRQGQRKAALLSMLPKETATFVVAMTDANASTPSAPKLAPEAPSEGNDPKMIDVTPNTVNPVVLAIENFQRRRGVVT
jgi:hypothetical protein